MIRALTKNLRILEMHLEVLSKVGIFEKLMMWNSIHLKLSNIWWTYLVGLQELLLIKLSLVFSSKVFQLQFTNPAVYLFTFGSWPEIEYLPPGFQKQAKTLTLWARPGNPTYLGNFNRRFK